MSIATSPFKSAHNVWTFPLDGSEVLYLPLYRPSGDMTGTTIYSYDKNRHACTVAGALWGPHGRDFSADNSITVPASTSINNLAAVTTIVWINPDSIGVGQEPGILHKAVGTITAGWKLYLLETNRFGVRVDYTTTDMSRVTVNNILTMEVWQYVASTWTGESSQNSCSLYLNGVLQTPSGGADGAGSRVDDSTSGLSIGNDAILTRDYLGVIGEVWIYNRVLTAMEIRRIYLATKWRYTS